MSREQKIEAARAALKIVEDGMKLGIGTGSTADEFIRLLADRVKNGLSISGVPTSQRTQDLCNELGIGLTTLEELPQLDLVIDGADEIDGDLNLIKGAGGALWREKIVANASAKMIVIADETKVVEQLGCNFPLPIEISPFGAKSTLFRIRETCQLLKMPVDLTIRNESSDPFLTDGGHFIADASFGHIPNAKELSDALLAIPGVVEHGLFLGYATTVYLAGGEGVKVLGANP